MWRRVLDLASQSPFYFFFLKNSGSESKHSLQSELLETFELPRSPGSQLEFLDLDVTTSGEPLISFPERQPSSELDQRPQDELEEEEGRDLEGWVQWQVMVQHTLIQKYWVQVPGKTLCCASVNPAVKWG